MKLFNVPLEPIELRYSVQWRRYFSDAFEAHRVPTIGIDPDAGSMATKIKRGQFLDIVDTNIYKSRQLQTLLEMINQSAINDGDWIFFHDLWFPGLEALFYVRQGLGLKFKIAGVFHAGTYDKYDFLSQRGMGSWGRHLENAWLDQIDKVFLSVPFHKDLIFKKRDVSSSKLICTYLPIFEPPQQETLIMKGDTVVFPHRLAPEKQPDKFAALEEELEKDPMLGHVTYISTMVNYVDKETYYNDLRRSKVAVSFSLQETWGIAMQEAVLCGCIPVVPNRLSYPDIFPQPFLFDGSVFEASILVKSILRDYDLIADSNLFRSIQQSILNRGAQAIPNMIKEMGFI